MQTTNYTFGRLIEEYVIEIPILQRDYAQGRTDSKTNTIRKGFLAAIFKKLSTRENLELDFVYGSTLQRDDKLYFIPLDGQQRLSTLFLLHWYLAKKEGKMTEDFQKTLSKFTYQTRISSRNFCLNLVMQGVDLPEKFEENSLSNAIKDTSWFFAAWQKDPTIKAMLQMLDAIHQTIHKDFNTTSDGWFDALLSESRISFQFLDLPNFGLTDALYIKMNARGKALTEFEHFKALFEQFLKNHTGLGDKTLSLNGQNLSYQRYFSQEIDGKWTDLFWQFKENDVIDKPFMHYFDFITEMLYYKDAAEKAKIPEMNTALREEVYQKHENIQFLFDSLNTLYNIEKNDIFFKTIFSNETYEKGKINSFKPENLSIFQRCLQNKTFDLRDKILLFALIQFLISRNAAEVSEDLTDFLRVLRNLLLRVRQQKGTSYGANLREEDLPKVIADISVIISYKTNIYTLLCDNRISKLSAFTEESLKYEQEKAGFISTHKDLIFKLEDHNLLQGSLHNFKLTENIDNLAILCEAMYAIWDKNTDNSLIIRAMLTIGDYSILIGWCELGDRYFFGTGDRWRTILTQNNLSQAEKVKGILIPFLLDFHKTEGETSNSRLTSMIEVWLNTNPDRDWRYYFIKYSSFTNFGRCLYAWQEASNFEIRHIHNGDTLQSSHINPYIRTVFFGVKERNVIFPKYDSDRWADITPLQLANGIKLNCNNIGWSIELPEGMSLSEELIAEFELRKTDATKLILVGNESLDRVEIAIDFAEKAYK